MDSSGCCCIISISMKQQTYIRTDIIKENKILTPEDYYCYIAHNNGACDVTIDGWVLKQGDTVDLSGLPTDSIHQGPITIAFGNNDADKNLCLKRIKITDKF